MTWEISLFNAVHGVVGKSSLFDFFIVLAAQYLPYAVVVAALFFFFTRKPVRMRLWIISTVALTIILSRGIVTELIRFFYSRLRPNMELGFEPLIQASSSSFPSGHAALFFALACVIYSFDKGWGRWFWGFAILNTLARVVAGVHWPTDIIGGLIVAILSFYVVRELTKKYAPKNSSTPPLDMPIVPKTPRET